ncbi:MAG: hypothetical protein M0R48_04260 [Candidatus Omnitrophica bacterium]|jgi:hypothetical protein|nr:hypothetical protein [Candidatus Omnitrophota bacterium]
MKKILIKNLNRRAKIYAAIIIFCILSVFVRIALVNISRSRTIISFVSEWNKLGKPVTVEKVLPRSVPVYTKLTVRGVFGKIAKGFVTGDIKDKLQQGQEVFCADRSKPCAIIIGIAAGLDTDTGMFPVEIEFNETLSLQALAIVFVCTRTIPNALVVPNEILDFSADKYYLWKVEDGKAKKIQVKVALRNGYGAVISEGINPGDLIVFRGRSILSEGDKVNIISDRAS